MVVVRRCKVIGDNAKIWANVVATHDISPNHGAGGVPFKTIEECNNPVMRNIKEYKVLFKKIDEYW